MSVREVQPIQLRYGASYDTERGPGGTVDLSNHNTLGKARVIGLRARYDGEIRDARAYYSQPSLRFLQVQLTGTVYFFEDRDPSTTTHAKLHCRPGGRVDRRRNDAARSVSVGLRLPVQTGAHAEPVNPLGFSMRPIRWHR